MTTTTPLTLSQLADIGAKAANAAIHDKAVAISPDHGCYKEDRPAREAFVQAVLDAIGYKLPVDPDREAFDKWASDFVNLPDRPEIFQAFKAGRQDAMKINPSCFPQTAKQPETIWTRHIPGDPRPCDAATLIDVLMRSEEDDSYIECFDQYIKHDSTWGEIIGWRLAKVKQPENDGWIPWSGGECPVVGNVSVRVKFRDGGTFVNHVSSYVWGHTNSNDDIIAYKITPQTTTP